MDYTHAYIGKLAACGCVVAIVVDMPDHQKDTARNVADFIKRGYAVERVSVEEGSQLVGRCKHEKPATVPTPQGALL